MSQWFKTSIFYDKMQENGIVKKVTESFLFDALSFSESEARTIEEVTPMMSGEFTIKTNSKTRIAEVFNIGADKYYLCKIAFIVTDEKTGMEKRSVSRILVGAKDFEDAVSTLKDGMKGTMADWEIISVVETPILDVYPMKHT